MTLIDLLTSLPEALEVLLLSLPPLETLKLTGIFEPRSIALALGHCGPQLRRLLFSSIAMLSADSFQQSRFLLANPGCLDTLRHVCPTLEEFSLCMFRSQGNAEEVVTYQALRRLPSPRKEHLSVLCPQSLTWSWRSCQEFADACENGQTIDTSTKDQLDSALIAMDKNLAHSVFSLISRSKPCYARRFEILELRNEGLRGHGGNNCDLLEVLRYITRSWICTGSQRDDKLHECISKE
ncbi:hypothetical protein AUEXF2481DRAFT_572392 [Aureobasidium subglaciale EXF-2481]|uniref:Uncharacterized protein n=1 Tax=Aureobasidium subglaciale (strain EXF-2481) TaxID=1043005 RepID=A0A074XXP8_AURSE|nr:uncharacterized protein AUEXF2481DRAFT_572392 [Aureobasidium subglaciale EXF-2481]KEQ90353.1 hypothetical protein AUEXF2481DRAFT_572392 [Aureobasidium subglaciale EXF-2481]